VIGNREQWADIASRIWPMCRADAIALGVLLAMAWAVPEVRAKIQKYTWVFLWGMFVWTGVAIVFQRMAFSGMNYGRVLNTVVGRTAVELACLSMVVFLMCRPQSWFGRFLSTGVMREFGKISYCLYLIHWGVFWILFRFVLHARFGEKLWLDLAMIPIGFAVCVALAELSWKYFEFPILLRAHVATKSKQPTPLPKPQPQTASV